MITGAILAAALALRAYRLTRQDYALDETIFLDYSRASLAGVFRLCLSDTFPPLFLYVLKLWRALTEWFCDPRWLTVAWGVAGVWATGAAVRHVAGARAGWLAALMAAVNPFAIYYSQDLRMNVMFAALTMLAAAAYARWDAPGERERRAPWTMAVWAVAACYTHYLSFMFLAPLFAYAAARAWRCGERRWRVNLAKAFVAFAAGMIPLAPYLLWQSAHAQHNVEWVPPARAIDIARTFGLIFPFGYCFAAPWGAVALPVASALFFAAWAGGWIAGCVCGQPREQHVCSQPREGCDDVRAGDEASGAHVAPLTGLTANGRGLPADGPGAVLFAATGIGSALLLYATSFTPRNLFFPYRYTIIGLLPFIALVAIGIARARPRALGAALALAWVAMGATCSIIQSQADAKPHWRALTRLIDETVGEDELLLSFPRLYANGYFQYSPRDHPVEDFEELVYRSDATPPSFYLLAYSQVRARRPSPVFPSMLPLVLRRTSRAEVLFADAWFTLTRCAQADFARLRWWIVHNAALADGELGKRDVLWSSRAAELDAPLERGFSLPLDLTDDFAAERYTTRERVEWIVPGGVAESDGDGPLVALWTVDRQQPTSVGAIAVTAGVNVSAARIVERVAPPGFGPATLAALFEPPGGEDAPLTLYLESPLWVPADYLFDSPDRRQLGVLWQWTAIERLAWPDGLTPAERESLAYAVDVGSLQDDALAPAGLGQPMLEESESGTTTTYRWTGAVCSFEAPRLKSMAARVEIAINARAGGPPSAPPATRIEVFWDGARVGEATLPHAYTTARFPVEFRGASGRLEIRSIASPPVAPEWSDERELGVQLNWIGVGRREHGT